MAKVRFKPGYRKGGFYVPGHPGALVKVALPGEPLIYSISIPVGTRNLSEQSFRNRQFRRLLRCWFRRQRSSKVAVVLCATFYVPAPESAKAKLTQAQLRAEKTFATLAYELPEYLLSLMEMLSGTLITSYCQIVHIECRKIYSLDPRTEFQFMRVEDYEYFFGHDTVHTKTKSIRTFRKEQDLQSLYADDESDEELGISRVDPQEIDRTILDRAAIATGSAFPVACVCSREVQAARVDPPETLY